MALILGKLYVIIGLKKHFLTVIDRECRIYYYDIGGEISETMEEKNYLTEQGAKELRKELKELERDKLETIRERAPRPLDYREADADYVSYQENLGRLESRIKELRRVLDNYQLIKAPPKKERDTVHLGATVVVEMEGTIEEFMIVGTFESDPAHQKISNKSPLGKNLLGRKVGEELEVKTPIVDQKCRIMKIKYESV